MSLRPTVLKASGMRGGLRDSSPREGTEGADADELPPPHLEQEVCYTQHRKGLPNGKAVFSSQVQLPLRWRPGVASLSNHETLYYLTLFVDLAAPLALFVPLHLSEVFLVNFNFNLFYTHSPVGNWMV